MKNNVWNTINMEPLSETTALQFWNNYVNDFKTVAAGFDEVKTNMASFNKYIKLNYDGSIAGIVIALIFWFFLTIAHKSNYNNYKVIFLKFVIGLFVACCVCIPLGLHVIKPFRKATSTLQDSYTKNRIAEISKTFAQVIFDPIFVPDGIQSEIKVSEHFQ